MVILTNIPGRRSRVESRFGWMQFVRSAANGWRQQEGGFDAHGEEMITTHTPQYTRHIWALHSHHWFNIRRWHSTGFFVVTFFLVLMCITHVDGWWEEIAVLAGGQQRGMRGDCFSSSISGLDRIAYYSRFDGTFRTTNDESCRDFYYFCWFQLGFLYLIELHALASTDKILILSIASTNRLNCRISHSLSETIPNLAPKTFTDCCWLSRRCVLANPLSSRQTRVTVEMDRRSGTLRNRLHETDVPRQNYYQFFWISDPFSHIRKCS